MSWLSRRQPKALARANPAAIVAIVVAAGMLAIVTAAIAQGYVLTWATRAVATRAVAQLEASLLADVTGTGLEAPSGQ